ncbi:glycosyltransferase family 4 protein [Ferrovibrio sp.]|uniref:MraY family glycosyltransferase n=1 Tax=Ferrovibrio sp. TaxID=1917215 RepID=UPI0025C20CCB|nr:glycosyltransferase family 4 protein [Ferrovibrio sp.]MBX3455610.1 glycosyltransferase family 4 protein [Ferrovibrio sp.]
MMAWLQAAGFAFGAGLITWLVLPVLIEWLRQRAMLDLPNERSSHVIPTPRGGGIAVIAAILVTGLPWITVQQADLPGLMLAAAAALALLSWFDDRLRGLPVSLRLGGQALAVILVLGLLPAEARVLPAPLQAWLPLWLERLLCFLAWLWFTNLFNFMDGIDGISGVEMAGIGLGLAACYALAGYGIAPAGLALIIAAAGLAFLRSNWSPAKVFMGDVGSVPVGFLLGGLLLQAALSGLWAAALILPLYYWCDATITLLKRLLRREKVWHAHRQHFYQQGSRKLGGHAPVAAKIAALNALLILLALLAQLGPRPWAEFAALALGLLLTLLLCRHFSE